jgi:threonine dehydratase
MDVRAVQAVRPAVEGIARRTPVLTSRTFSELAGGEVVLKAENLQLTGSFKVRGAAAKLAALGDSCASGVVCASAGNHGQGVAAAAAARGVPCEVFVPANASIAKTEAIASRGAKVHRGGAAIEDCMGSAMALASERGLVFVHPFDDPDIIAGQGSLGLELVEDVPDLAKVVVPIGGGGLAAGVAMAVKGVRPDVEVVGVRATDVARTIADGIAVKGRGALTEPLLDALLDDQVVVGEDELAEAMFLCLERAKLVVEGGGAAGVAALIGGQTTAARRGSTVAILSGGNVDAGLLAAIARRHETEAGRRLVVMTRLQDRPGALAGLVDRVAGTGANIVDVAHVREGVDLHVRETAVELVLETRGRDHAEAVLAVLGDSGYEPRVLR